MLKRPIRHGLLAVALLALNASVAAAKSAGFDEVVKLIESHYHVRHKGTPLLASAGIKMAGVVARRLTHYAQYGSVKVAVFEDQDFSAPQNGKDFATAVRSALQPEWMPLVQVRLQQDAEQTYIYTKEAGQFFKVMVVTISRRDATAVEMEVAAHKLFLLMKDPDSMGKTLTDDATSETPGQ